MRFLYLILLVSTFAFADGELDDRPCVVPLPRNYSIEQLQELKEKLEWWGASTEQVKTAPCKAKSAPSEEEMQRLVDQKSAGAKKSEVVFGVSLKNESPVMIQALKDLTKRQSLYGGPWYSASEDQVPIQQTYSINPTCDKALCAIDKIWGPKLGRKILHMYLKHGFNGSELAFDSSDRFKENEIDDVLMTLDDLPSHLQPLGERKNQRLVPFTPGYTLKDYGPNVLANSGVILFDSWRAKDSGTRQYASFHELGHNLSDKMRNADASPQWIGFSGWKKTGDEWSHDEGACIMSKYGETSPAEDFAEVATAYRYNAKGLEEKCPEKYKYMKEKVFKGMEYKTSLQCANITDEKMQKAQAGLSAAISKLTDEMTIETSDVDKSCTGTFSNFPASNSELNLCAIKVALGKMPQSQITAILAAAGVSDSELNRSLILDNWMGKIEGDAALKDKLSRPSDEIAGLLDKVILEAQIQTVPKDAILPVADDYVWYSVRRECGKELIQAKEASKCAADKIVSDDEKKKGWDKGYLPSLKIPSVFNEKAQADIKASQHSFMVNEVSQLEIVRSASQKNRENFRKDLLTFMDYTQYQKESKMPAGWKDLSPKDFCSKTYGVGDVFLGNWGLKDQPLPLIQQRCEEIQSSKSKRFFMKDSLWKEWVMETWK
ncbi:MAG: hypothetical protein K2P81_09800 [Bacteriovoracaceae bacterium]|nr:hypothetical protein [Bacteriovoracaceae bacterium]